MFLTFDDLYRKQENVPFVVLFLLLLLCCEQSSRLSPPLSTGATLMFLLYGMRFFICLIHSLMSTIHLKLEQELLSLSPSPTRPASAGSP
jgi:hypothetical protein